MKNENSVEESQTSGFSDIFKRLQIRNILLVSIPIIMVVGIFMFMSKKEPTDESSVAEKPSVKGKVHIEIVPPAPIVDTPQPGENVGADFVFSGKGSEEGAVISVVDMNNPAQGSLCQANVMQSPSLKWECKSEISLLKGIYKVKITETDTTGTEGDPTIVEFYYL